jgi:DNA polymerase III alpha subunit
VPEPAARQVLALVERFKGASFNKAHAVAVAVIAWQEVQLRGRCPLAFWTAALNNHEDATPCASTSRP